MRLQLALLNLLVSTAALADDKSIRELFEKYDQVFTQKKTELVDEVFSRKFLRESGGKAEFVSKVQGLEAEPKKIPVVTWKKGSKNQMFYVTLELKPLPGKAPASEAESAEFLVVQEDGKFKIDGTLEQ